MIFIVALHSKEHGYNGTRNNNSGVVMVTNSKYGSTIPFSTESIKNENKLMNNKIIRREKEDTPKGCQVLEISIVTDNNKAVHNKDRVSIKGRKILKIELFKTDDSRAKNYTIESDSIISEKIKSKILRKSYIHPLRQKQLTFQLQILHINYKRTNL